MSGRGKGQIVDLAIGQLLSRLETRDYRAAHSGALGRLSADPADGEAYLVLALIAFDHRNLAKAFELIAEARELAPDNALIAAQHARMLSLAGRQAEARTLAEGLSEVAIDDAHVADTVGVVLSRAGLHETAVDMFTRAVALDPAPANYHYNLGASLQFLGRFEAASDAYEDTLARAPGNHRALASLVSLAKQTAETSRLDELEHLFEAREGTDPDAALQIGHAIAKTLEDLGDHPASLGWLARAKAGKTAQLEYDVADDLTLFAAAKPTAGPGPELEASPSDAPIFIVGLPRTGTTLVDRILSSHPDVASVGELNAFAEGIKRLSGTATRHVLDPQTFAAMEGRDVSKLGHDYLAFTERLARGHPRFADKMPLNVFNAGLIHRALPNARIVCLRRDPRDSCLSNYRQLFATGFSYYNYTFRLEDIADYYLAFDDLVAHWQAELPADRFEQIAYEDIVFDQEAQTRRLLDFCDLSWDEACLRFHENDAPVATASSVQVRQPLYSGSVGRWRRYGNGLDAMIARLAPVLGDGK